MALYFQWTKCTHKLYNNGQNDWCTGMVIVSTENAKFHSVLFDLYNAYLFNLNQGFRIVWTEVQDSTQIQGPSSSILNHCEPTYLFHCTVSSYCISNKLHCDGLKNCGPGDDSDEMNCES